jgi:uncharacterized protein (DUF427 family)
MILNYIKMKEMTKATWKNEIIAESGSCIEIEGNQYFPPDSLKKKFFKKSDKSSTCPWKGEASYYDIVVNGEINKAAAWYYPSPLKGGIKKVGKDFTDYVAFWNWVKVSN